MKRLELPIADSRWQIAKSESPSTIGYQPFAISGLLLAIIISLAVFALPAHAQTPTPIVVPVALAPIQRDSPVALVALTLDVEIGESNGHTFLVGNSTFKLHNTDRLNDLQVPVGFPAWAGDPFVFSPTQLSAFTVSVDGKKVPTLNPARADLKIGKEVRAVDWYTFTLALAGDEKKTVRVDLQQDLGDGALPRLVYGIVPAEGWKGNIGSARLTIRFPDLTTLEQIIAYDPANVEFDGVGLTWRFQNYTPPANPSLTFLQPSLWSDLVAKRRAVQQNPNDANARAALGVLLRQLAQLDSPRRDSFYAQAIAELETATRLDPSQRAARQTLAAMHEARAGPAMGPRNVAYVQLAVTQWEALASNDANARKQLAEDYFYLGLDAQTRGAFADALAYYDKAHTFAPGGAGPLFTLERAAAQRRALNLAWARALVDAPRNDAGSAADKARAVLGDAFMASYQPPMFYVTRAQVSMSPQAREMVFTLVPLQSAETRKVLNDVVASLRAAGADAAFDDATLSITVPFNDSTDLLNKLAALAPAVPDEPEWSLVRAILSPDALVWEETEEWLTRATRYQESVDLSVACRALTAQLDAISKNLAPLENAAKSDDEAQLKRALLQHAQSGWRAALAQGRVTYRAGPGETRVDTCTSRTIAWSSSSLRAERIALIVAAVELLGIGILVVRRRRTKGTGRG